MTTPDTAGDAEPASGPETAGGAEPASGPEPSRRRWRRRPRRPAPRANVFWRFVFPVLVVIAGLAVFVLWRAGAKSILDSTDGREVELVVDPAAPGYEAFVDPTPTLLVAHTDGGALVGVTVMAQTALEQGGSAVLLGTDLLVDYKTDDGQDASEFLAQAWSEGGLDRVEFLVEQLFGFGFTEAIELDAENLGRFLGQVEPLPYLLADDLLTESESGATTLWLAKGRKDLDGVEAARIYGFRNPGEAEANRWLRQQLVWKTWLESIARSADPQQATLGFQAGLSPFLRSLGIGVNDVSVLPMEQVGLDPEDPPFYVLESDSGAEWLRARALEMVPLPISPKSSVRPTVKLLDGTGDSVNRDRSGADVVAAGGVISVIGNAAAFGAEHTTVLYHRPEVAAQATMIASALGVEAVLADDVEQPTDLTVTIGLDRVAS